MFLTKYCITISSILCCLTLKNLKKRKKKGKLTGREIVEEVQSGEDRAEYGKKVLETLSTQLNQKYGRGFSTTNLKNFRSFYQTYSGEIGIRHPMGSEFNSQLSWSHYRALMRITNEKR